jgi:hypothetical protein
MHTSSDTNHHVEANTHTHTAPHPPTHPHIHPNTRPPTPTHTNTHPPTHRQTDKHIQTHTCISRCTHYPARPTTTLPHYHPTTLPPYHPTTLPQAPSQHPQLRTFILRFGMVRKRLINHIRGPGIHVWLAVLEGMIYAVLLHPAQNPLMSLFCLQN